MPEIVVTVKNKMAVGDGSVIAACACVAKDVPPDTLAVGIPAKVMKEFKNFATDAQEK